MMEAVTMIVMARMEMIMMKMVPCMFKQGPAMCLNSPKESGNSCCNNDRSVTDALLMIVA